MNTTRRDLLRSTLLVAAVPRVGLQDAPPVAPPLAAPSGAAAPGPCGLDEAFVDHGGWIVRREDREALPDRSGTAPGRADAPAGG